MLLVEQKLPFARRVASEFRILEKGRCVAGGPIDAADRRRRPRAPQRVTDTAAWSCSPGVAGTDASRRRCRLSPAARPGLRCAVARVERAAACVSRALRHQPAAAADAAQSRRRGLGLHLELRRRARRRRSHRRSTSTSAPGAAAFVSTQASTKVYRSPRGHRARELHARVGARRRCSSSRPIRWCCFAGRRYRAGAAIRRSRGRRAWSLVDWVTSGRRASGERWAFDEYVQPAERRRRRHARACTTRWRCARADGDLAARLGRFDVLALVLVLGRPLAGRRGSARRRRCARRRSTDAVATGRRDAARHARLGDGRLRRAHRRARRSSRSDAAIRAYSRLRAGAARRRSLGAQVVTERGTSRRCI